MTCRFSRSKLTYRDCWRAISVSLGLAVRQSGRQSGIGGLIGGGNRVSASNQTRILSGIGQSISGGWTGPVQRSTALHTKAGNGNLAACTSCGREERFGRTCKLMELDWCISRTILEVNSASALQVRGNAMELRDNVSGVHARSALFYVALTF